MVPCPSVGPTQALEEQERAANSSEERLQPRELLNLAGKAELAVFRHESERKALYVN